GEDRSLIERVQQGDRQAFRRLVEQHQAFALSLAVSILKDPHRAEDVLQEVLIKVFIRIKSYRFKSSFSTWLYRIVVNHSYNELKKKKYLYPIEEIRVEQAEREETSVPLQAKNQKKYVNMALQRMKADEALVLRLFYLSEYAIAEIKEITGFSSAKIKVDLHRGRKNFKYYLEKLVGAEINELL
ncbi:MAG: RNA polymerase sigma factor, partial [Bacteroidota bacterium]